MKKEQQYLQEQLAMHYAAGEAAAIARWVFENRFHYTRLDYCLGKDREFSKDEREDFENIVSRLLENEPLQYILGETEFCGLHFSVNRHVLIPRPETEELVRWIADDAISCDAPRILDWGTGSGCIAISLAHLLPNASVAACDLSAEALAVARQNADDNGVSVSFFRDDMLQPEHLPQEASWDVWVSNPPYICESERVEMDRNVLDYEPASALFVSDDDPLLFYRAVACHGLRCLHAGALLYFEINRAYGSEMVQMLQKMGYQDVELRQDLFGNNRMIKCRR